MPKHAREVALPLATSLLTARSRCTMTRLARLSLATAILAYSGTSYLYATNATPSPTNLSIATYYNSGSGFTSAWQPGGGTGAAPSSGSIIRLSAFYRDANGTVYDLGQGSATASITFTVSGNTYKIGATAPCACRPVEFSPGLSLGAVSYSGVTLGTRSAYTLVMMVASTPDPNGPITAADYQYAENNEIVYTSVNNMKYVAVRLVSYTTTDAASDFLTYTVSGTTVDSRTVTFTVTGDATVYTANLTPSNNKVIVTLLNTDHVSANAVAITWSQSAPGDMGTYVWVYPSTPPIN